MMSAGKENLSACDGTKELYFVGSNAFRLSRCKRYGEKHGILWSQHPLKEDPYSPLGLLPQYIAAEKALLALESLQKNIIDMPKMILAVDTMNGIVVGEDEGQKTVFKSKPTSLDEVKRNLTLFQSLEDDHACFQVDVSHAILFPNNPDISVIITTRHKGFIPHDRLAFLQSDRGWVRFNELVEQYKVIRPLHISAGIPWPILFMMNVFDQLDQIPESEEVHYTQKKGEILRHVVSFDEEIFRIAQTGLTYNGIHDAMSFSAYLEMKKSVEQ